MTAPFRDSLRSRLACLVVFVALATVAATPAAYASTPIGWFDYARNGSNINGTLTWKYTWDDIPPVYSISWRGGSGIYLDDRTNGWIPVGWYSIRSHYNNYSGNAIYGRVWYLSDKVGVSGALRQGLFIHTEETPSNGQYNPTSGDDPQAWEGDFDYKSLGCVKVKWGADMDNVHYYWTNRGGSAYHGSGWPYPYGSKLYVH